jgi:hypothetical protein
MNERTNTFFAKKHNHDGKRNYLQNMTNKKNGLFSLTWVHRFGWVHVAHLISCPALHNANTINAYANLLVFK